MTQTAQSTFTTGFSKEAFEELAARNGYRSGPLGSLREEAFRQFEALPVPSPQTEEWRNTDLRKFDLGAYRTYKEEPKVANLDGVRPEVLAAAGEVGDRAGLSIQHNSTVITTHLDPEAAAQGVIFASLDEAGVSHPELLARFLHEAVPTIRTRFTALHGAFRTGGTLVYVPAGVRVELPLQALTYVDADGLAVFPHTLLVLEEDSALTFIDRYVSPRLERVLSDAVVEIDAGANAKVHYVSLQEWGEGVTHLSVQRANVGRDAEVRSLSVAFGASLARAEAESILTGDGGSSEMLGVYFGDGRQHFDHRSIQDHVGSNTSSDLLYKGALKDRARAVYWGNVIIRPGAHKCDAYQTNRNILLSDQAGAFPTPNLEILSNDPVRCGHAASVGPVDPDELFYIQTRGIPYKEAERLIVFGFFQEVLDRVTLPEVRKGLEAAINEELTREDAHDVD